jgi:hypothetical protein
MLSYSHHGAGQHYGPDANHDFTRPGCQRMESGWELRLSSTR